MADAVMVHADIGAWSLAALADEASFDRHYESVAAAIADRIAAKVHINVLARRHAFADFVNSLEDIDTGAIGYRHFIGVCAGFIASLAGQRIIAYATAARDPPDRMVDAVVKYPNEVTALASGAAVYLLRVRDLTGVDPSLPVSALVMENAAAQLRRRADAAIRFRELLRLTTPWA